MSDTIIPFTDAQWAAHFKVKAEAADARASEVAKELRDIATEMDPMNVRGGRRLVALADRLEDADPKEQTPEPCKTCRGEGYVNRWDESARAYEDVPSPCPDCSG